MSLLIAWASAGQAVAQLPNLVELSATYIPDVALRDPKPATTQLTSYDITLNLPIPLSDRVFLIPGVNYHVEAVSFANVPSGFAEPPRAFHSAEVALMLVQLLPRDWALASRIAAGLAADQLAFESDLARISAMVMATNVLSDELTLGAGALLSYSFGELLPLPGLYVSYQPTVDLQVEAFLPAFARSVVTMGRIELGVRAEVAGNDYGVRDGRIAGAYPCAPAAADVPITGMDERVADGGQCLDHVAYSVLHAGLTAAVRLFGDVWLSGLLGRTLYRRFDTANYRGGPIAAGGGGETFPNQWLARAALAWRLPTEDE